MHDYDMYMIWYDMIYDMIWYDMIYVWLWYVLYDKDTSEARYKLLIEKHKPVGLKYCNDSRAFINTRMI